MTILAHAVSAILYVAVGWWAARDDMPLPTTVRGRQQPAPTEGERH